MLTALALNLDSQLTAPGQNLESYMRTIRSIPILSSEEEHELAKRLRQQGDLQAARILVMSHLRFVMHIVYGYRGYGLPLADLIQEGNIGLMKAVKRFDPKMGVRLITFAVHWIRAQIHEYILANWRIVKVVTTKAQRKLFFGLRHAKKHLGWLNQSEAENIAKDLGVSTQDVLEMEKRLTAQDTAFDGPTDSEEENGIFSPAAYVEDHRYDPAVLVEQTEWETYGQQRLHTALVKLDERSRDVLQKRWLCEEEDRATLSELAQYYHVTAERIRQIEENALKKLKKNLCAIMA